MVRTFNTVNRLVCSAILIRRPLHTGVFRQKGLNGVHGGHLLLFNL